MITSFFSENCFLLYGLLADITVLIHFLFVLFVVFGGVGVLRWKRLILAHLPAAVWGVVIELAGWICPLTYLENYLYSLYNRQLAYAGSFIGQYLQKLIYLDLDEAYLRIAAVIWVAINLGGYVLLFKKRKSIYP